jgi:L-seryl-tRNA(Ser) seleniumtransferase
MGNPESLNYQEVLRFLPSVDSLLQTETAQNLAKEIGAKRSTVLARTVIDELRRNLQENSLNIENHSKEILLAKAEKYFSQAYKNEQNKGVTRVINATGVIIHTNLGRAPLAEKARQAIVDEVSRYCTLEYSIETGKRGKRGARAEQLLAELTGAEDSLIVNNCAAACVLVLTALAQGGEAILSRGEMVEIGGDFRIPDVMQQSGAILREVGATNKTRVSDYENAIGENTRLIVKVHPSNYRIIGFTATPTVADLAEIAHKNNIILYEDAGSGALIDLSKYGLKDEPVISDSIKAGADVITFSGDKLLGGVQSGLIVGKHELIETLRKHPLYRALRADKIVYAALEATLEIYRRESFSEIPVLRMLALTKAEIITKTQRFAAKLGENLSGKSNLRFELIDGHSVVGGGSAPDVQPETKLLSLSHNEMSAAQIEEKLRLAQQPIITRILEDKVTIDLRTVFEDEEKMLLDALDKLN